MVETQPISPLSVQNVSKYFYGKAVLKHINLTLKPGEIYGLVGVNGAGKTTLIKIILNLLFASEGTVQFFGQDATLARHRTCLAYVPEKFSPSPLLTGKEFLSLAVSYHRERLDEVQLARYAHILDLDPTVLSKRIGQYSKGMGQKLGLLAAFLVHVPLLILDEPMSGLDPSARIRLKSLLKTYVAEGNTVFFSSHILSDMDEICHRMAVMHQGLLAYEGTPAGLLALHHTSQLEKAFLGVIGA